MAPVPTPPTPPKDRLEHQNGWIDGFWTGAFVTAAIAAIVMIIII